jgi:DNA-binding FadR family transcriptional regulator
MADALRKAIETGIYATGDRLPTEQDLGKEFGVSRVVVREAITILKAEGVIESFQGKGMFVTTADGSTMFRLPAPDLTSGEELSSIMEFLIAHEVAATGYAAMRRSERDLADIRASLDVMADAVASNREGVDEDFTFHQRIVSASKNPHFIAFNNFLENSVRSLIRSARANTAKLNGMAQKVQLEHQRIYEAIAAGDRPAAEIAAENHLRATAERLRLGAERE